jgi:CRISPR/Cas system-associated exonuclease Cas4 (RecB family)
MWDACRLRYYYAYIGKWEGFKGDLNREKLQWLSKKTCWYMVEGSLVHKAIESQISQWCMGRPVSKDAAKNLFNYKLGEIQQNPRDHLVDEINGFAVPEEGYTQCRQSGQKLLDGFFDIIWPNYAKLEYVKHEEFDSFDLDGTRVWTKIDLVTRMPDKTVVVTDWKTGKTTMDGKENEGQLQVYVLWAVRKLKMDEPRIRAEVRYLRQPDARPILVQADKPQLSDLSKFIVDNSKAMLSVQSASDFPPTSSSKQCRECPFATICSEGQNHILDHARSKPIGVR